MVIQWRICVCDFFSFVLILPLIWICMLLLFRLIEVHGEQ